MEIPIYTYIHIDSKYIQTYMHVSQIQLWDTSIHLAKVLYSLWWPTTYITRNLSIYYNLSIMPPELIILCGNGWTFNRHTYAGNKIQTKVRTSLSPARKTTPALIDKTQNMIIQMEIIRGVLNCISKLYSAARITTWLGLHQIFYSTLIKLVNLCRRLALLH